jgi:hypothetical protein
MNVVRFYEAALTALRYVERRTPTGRRFGPDADARWSTLRGLLSVSHRIDLLLRDADTQFPGAFGARVPFQFEGTLMRGASVDDAFGAAWTSLTPAAADFLWMRVLSLPAPVSPVEALRRCAALLGLESEPELTPTLRPAMQLVVSGPSAIVAVAERFAEDAAGGGALAWDEQVTCVATPPAHRQLAGLVAPLLNTKRSTRLRSREEPVTGRVDAFVVSDDADPWDWTACKRVREVAS